MREQSRRVSPTAQVKTSQGSTVTNVAARPVSTFVAPQSTNINQLASALDRFSPGLEAVLTQNYITDAQESLDKGNLEGMTGQPMTEGADQFEFHGFHKAASIRKGLDTARAIQDEAMQVRPDDQETWGDYKNPVAAVEGILAARTNEAIQGVDPQFAPYILAGVERAKGHIIEAKRQETQQHVTMQLTDNVAQIAHESLLEHTQDATPESTHALFSQLQKTLTSDGLLDRKEATEFLADQFGQFAIDQKNPDLLKFMDVKDSSGVAVAQTSAGDKLRQALGKAQAEKDKVLSTERVTFKAYMQKAVDDGSFDENSLVDVLNEHPEYYTNDELAGMLASSMRSNMKQGEKTIYMDKIRSGDSFDVPDGADKKKSLDAVMESIQLEGEANQKSPEDIRKQQLMVLNQNGAIESDSFKSIINNGANFIDANINSGPPAPFLDAVHLYNQMYQVNPSLAIRHNSDKMAEKNIMRFNAWKMAGRSDEEAYARLRQVADRPLIEAEEFAKSGAARDLNDAIDNMEKYKNNGTMGSIFRSMATRYAELGLDTNKAIEGATNFVNLYYKEVNGRLVSTGGREMPPDFEEFNNWYIEKKLGKSKDDFYLMPNPKNANVMHVVGDFAYSGDPAITFSDAYGEYKATKTPSAGDANKSFQEQLQKHKEMTKQRLFSMRDFANRQPDGGVTGAAVGAVKTHVVNPDLRTKLNKKLSELEKLFD